MPWHDVTNFWHGLPHAVARYHKLLEQAATCRGTVSQTLDTELPYAVTRYHKLLTQLPYTVTRYHKLLTQLPHAVTIFKTLGTELPHAVTRCHKLLTQATVCRDTVSQTVHEISYVPHSSQFLTDEVLLNCWTVTWFCGARNKACYETAHAKSAATAYVVIFLGYVPVSTCINTGLAV
jgi:hypothetical protein